MLHQIILFTLIFLCNLETFASKNVPNLSPSIEKHILNFRPYISSTVTETTTNNIVFQNLKVRFGSLHKRKCEYVFKKLSRYENYSKYLSFVKKSKYFEKRKRVEFYLSSIFLPFDMILNFKIPRIKGPGEYPFIFDSGFLKGLNGNIHVSKKKFKNNKDPLCFIYINAEWKGKKTKIPNTVFELFTSTIIRLGLTKLYRVSGHLP